MSMKIYEAYIIDADDPWPVLWSIRERAEAEARQRLRRVYTDIIEGRAHEQALWWQRVDRDFVAWQAETGGNVMVYLTICAERVGPKPDAVISVLDSEIVDDGRPHWGDAAAWLFKQYTAQLGSQQRNAFNLDVAVHVWVDGRRFYLIPQCDHVSLLAGSLDFMDGHPGLSSFAYWNNSDRPDKIGRAEWDERGDTWRRLLADRHDFVLPIVDRDRVDRVDPFVDLWRDEIERNEAAASGVDRP